MRKPSPVVAQKLHVLSKKVLFQRQVSLAQRLNAWSVREHRELPNSLVQGFTYVAAKSPLARETLVRPAFWCQKNVSRLA